MQQIATHIAVLVTASSDGDAIGRELLARGVSFVGATGSLVQLRRSLVRGSVRSPLILCITLDDPTIRRHGDAITSILEDRCSFPTPVHAIGVRVRGSAGLGWQTLGCDAIAADQSRLETLLEQFGSVSMAEGSRFSFASTDSLLDRFSTRLPTRVETRDSEFRWQQR